ncbi:hypothetical protein PFHG_04689 [Plasmodium falciparum HB3]|uniref:Uncharacterized protein n=15 Tax=Plasmodium falciparum TaxID=5833 RepID=A0A0L7KJ42_PLAFX|nr:hypothetical protein PFHG_04689 [Plasmodium falciparum HB3]
MTSIVEINEDTEMNSLEETQDKLLELYENFKKEKNIINNNYKIVHFNKLKEIENSLETYNSISTNFNKINETQNIDILKNEFNNIKTKINDKVKELVHVDSTLTLESIQTFNNLYGDLMSNIQDVYKYEDINNVELKKVKLYIENITNLLGRINTFIKELDKYQDENNGIDKYIEINKENNSYIIKLKEKANNLKENFSKLLQNIKRNETELYNINNIKDDIMNTGKSVNNIKQKFSSNLPLKEKLFQMEEMLLNINNIMNETKRISNTDAYTNITLQDIENNKNKENNNMNIETIDKLIDHIKIHNEKIQAEILIIDDAKRKVKEITDNINKAFNEITENYNNENNGVIKSAKNIVDEATYLNNELDKFLLKLNELLSHNNNDIKDLGDEKLILKEEEERKERERLEKAKQEEERKERERIEKEKQEKERLEREKQEQLKKEALKKQEQERQEQQQKEEALKRQEQERLQKEEELKRQEQERLEREKQEQLQKEEELKRQEQERLQKEEALKRQEQERLQKEEELKRQEQERLERKKIELAEREQHIKSKLESDMVKIIKDELTKEKDEIIKNKDIKLRHSLEQKWLKHLQNILSLKIDSLLNKNDEVIKDNETQLKTNILNSLKNQLYLNLKRELNEIIKEYEENQKKILHSNQLVNDSLEQKTNRLVDIKPTKHGDIYTNKLSDNETEMLITSKEKKDETESTKRSGTDHTNSSESTTDDNTNDRNFSRSKNLSVAIYTAGSVALCVLIFSSIGLLLIKTNSGDNNSNEINEAFEPNDDVLFKEKDEIIEITFNDNDSTI